ncbi:major centromere autoantigen B-like [Ornithodoros turicata]|uniref:major centromere autoantigen B-like n=1 Tax=Ornithodoros turicata TaxID=34597 RepID=UPI0031397397
MSRKRKALSFKEKLEVLSKVNQEPKKKGTKLEKELGLAPSMLSTIVSQREQILKCVQYFGANVEQEKTAQRVNLEVTLLTWFKQVTAAGIKVERKVAREKVDNVAVSLKIDSFQT